MSLKDKSYSEKLDVMEGGFNFDNGFQSFNQLVSGFKDRVRHFLEGTQACEMFDIFCNVVEDSCLLKFLLGSLLLLSFLPVFAFGVFAVLSLITTITGFLIVEGTLLLLAAFATLLWLGSVAVIFVSIVGLGVIFYLLYKNAEDMAFKIEKFFFSQRSENGDEDMVVVDTDHED